MINREIQFPFYAKASIFFIGLVAFVAILYIAQGIIVPIVFSVIVAILLHPVVNFFVRLKINRIIAIVIALLNTFLKPILILLTIPVTVLTLGLFLLVINAFIILFASELVNGFKVDGFWWALLFSIILSVVTSLLNSIAGTHKQPQQ